MLILTHQQQTAFKNIVGKEHYFLLNQKIVSPFVNMFDILSLIAAELEEPTIDIWGNGLMMVTTLFFSLFSSPEHGVLSELLWSLTFCLCVSVRPSTILLLTL